LLLLDAEDRFKGLSSSERKEEDRCEEEAQVDGVVGLGGVSMITDELGVSKPLLWLLVVAAAPLWWWR
jgi:hypothetical protein